jgi:ribosome-binding protein aMBF1 (putative translation factor)
MTTLYIPHCWICGRTVSSGNSQIDESGLAVHESCYVTKVALEKGQSQLSAVGAKVASKNGQSQSSTRQSRQPKPFGGLSW